MFEWGNTYEKGMNECRFELHTPTDLCYDGKLKGFGGGNCGGWITSDGFYVGSSGELRRESQPFSPSSFHCYILCWSFAGIAGLLQVILYYYTIYTSTCPMFENMFKREKSCFGK